MIYDCMAFFMLKELDTYHTWGKSIAWIEVEARGSAEHRKMIWGWQALFVEETFALAEMA